MESFAATARAISSAFVAGSFDEDEMVDRGARVLGRRWRWLRPLARRVAGQFAAKTLPRHRDVTGFILVDRGFLKACKKHDVRIVDLLAVSHSMCPVATGSSWHVPSLLSAGELAEWLGLRIAELQWFADLRAMECKRGNQRLRHYHYRPLTKRFGQVRLIESPKPRLKDIQRQILAEILRCVPAHSAAHGFIQGRSIKTFAMPHVGKRVVLKIDLENFFTSISGARVQAVFRTVGYPEEVADLLTGLCVNTTPYDAWEGAVDHQNRLLQCACWRYRQSHLPQGAPTSPALANLCAYRMDCRLAGLASSAGAVYTRYADDLAFSGNGDFQRVVKRFYLHAAATVAEEGFSVHYRKTRMMRQGVRQRLTGLVVNERLNVARADFDQLKAILTNCVRLGPQSQNRAAHENFRAHLDGRISFIEMVNPARGGKLRRLFDRIGW